MKFADLLKYTKSMGLDTENFVREIFQKLILYSISVNNLYDFYIFQGGTAIRLAYGSPRFSLDLDFTIINRELDNLKEDANKIVNTISRYLLLDSISVEKRREKVAFEANFYRYFITFDTIKYLKKKIRVKLELLIREYTSLKTNKSIMEIEYPIKVSFGIKVKTPNQILCDKIAALAGGMHRKYIRWRDVFDVYWLINKFNAKIDKKYLCVEFGSWIETKDDLTKLFEYLEDIIKTNNFSEMKKELSILLPRNLLYDEFLKDYINVVLGVLKEAMEVLE